MQLLFWWFIFLCDLIFVCKVERRVDLEYDNHEFIWLQ